MARHTISDFMTENPFCIGATESVSAAREEMLARGIRHLPVVRDDDVVGVISWGDIHVLESVMGVDAERMTVGEVATKAIATVSPDTPLGKAAQMMAEQHIGSLLVLEGSRLRGVFTASDAVRALAVLAQT